MVGWFNRLGLKLSIIVTLGLAVFGIFQAGMIWNYLHEHPQTSYVYNVHEQIPAEALHKLMMFNRLRDTIYLGLAFFVLYNVFDYRRDPDKHWVKTVESFIGKLKKNDKEGLE